MKELQPRSYGYISCFCKSQSDTIRHAVLTANTENHAMVVPAEANAMFLSVSPSNTDYYFKQGGTAAIPTVDVLAGCGSEHNPIDGRSCTPGETLSFISASPCIITIAYYK